MEIISSQFLLKGKYYGIIGRFKHFNDIKQNISNSLISGSFQYHVNSDVSEEVFQSFINYLEKDDIPDIQFNNINEYRQLSQEFGILSEKLDQKTKEFGEFKVNLNDIQNNQDSSYYEEQIAQKLDYNLEKYRKELMDLPIQTLYRIFNHPNRNLTKHDLAYEVIKHEIEKKNNSNIVILLNLLDGSQMSKKNLEECLSLYKEQNESIVYAYLAKVSEEHDKLESEVSELKRSFEDMKNKCDMQKSLIAILENNIQKFQHLEEKHSKEIEDIKKMFEMQQQKIETLGSMATQNEDDVRISGGTITGLSAPMTVEIGGTGLNTLGMAGQALTTNKAENATQWNAVDVLNLDNVPDINSLNAINTPGTYHVQPNSADAPLSWSKGNSCLTVRCYGTMINQKLYDIQNCNEYVRYSANSGATWTNWLPTIERFVQVVARHGSSQAIAANVTTKIEFNGFYHKSIFISDDFGWSTTNYNFVVPFTGLYKFEFSINLKASTAITTSPKICTYVYNNNSIIQNKGTNWISGISNRINDTYVIYAQQGSVIDFRILCAEKCAISYCHGGSYNYQDSSLVITKI